MISPVMPTYARADLMFERGHDAYLVAKNGAEYLDFCSGVAVTGLGHAHPHLVEALTAQIGKVWHTSNLFRIEGQERLAQRLVDATFADTVFFCNSGAESIECAVKVARKYQSVTGHPERYRVLTFDGAFHGRTLATLAAGRQEKHLKGFGPVVEGFDQVLWGDSAAARASITAETAAILVEPVQGEGGIHLPPEHFLANLRKLADDNGLLLLYDEVQTGMGRCGHLFAYQHFGIVPDVLAVAKGLGGGFPVGACLATATAAQGMTAGSHGSTFGGNPLAVAAANAVLDVMLADGFFAHVRAMHDVLMRRLKETTRRYQGVIAEVRGLGLLIGIKSVVANGDLAEALRNRHVLTALAGDNVVRFLPPLIVEERHIDQAIAALEGACAELAAK